MSKTNVNREDLYLYNLPEKVTASLELLYFDSLTLEAQDLPLTEENLRQLDGDPEPPAEPSIVQSIRTEEDVAYYKSDLYKFNLKRSLKKLPPLTEEEFETMLEEHSIESLSGSESGSEIDEKDSLELKLQSLMNMTIHEDEEEVPQNSVSYLNTKSPLILFKSSLLPQDRAFGVYKSLFSEEELLKPLETLKGFSSLKNKKSALFMIGGGHFAGAIVSHVPKNTKGNATNSKQSVLEQSVNIIASKTFHRYTTRRKQGGSQSASDNARGKANSAGSSIRRHNEQALIKEVRELLSQWSLHLKDCTSIYIRASGATNRKTLIGYESAVLKNDDRRIKNFPFTTKRATTSELKRAWVELSFLTIAALPKVNVKIKKKLEEKEKIHEQQEIVSDKTPEQIENEKHSVELVGLLKKQKAPKLLSYMKSNKIDGNTFRLTPQSKYINYPTLLHFSSANGLGFMVQLLLTNLKADPTTVNDFDKTAAEIYADKATKRAFQIARFKLGEGYCDWDRTNIGPPKSKEVFDKEDELETKRINTEKQRLIKEELAKKTELELKTPRYSSGGTLGGGVPSVNELSGLSDQQKMRLMREQRARAAEARFKKEDQ